MLPTMRWKCIGVMLLAGAAMAVEFEAVSIKPADSAAPGRMAQATPGGFRGRNLRLFELVMNAWQLNRDQIVGGPGWMETAGFDIDGRFPAGAGPQMLPAMMQAMLTDRFRLVTHREARMLPMYALTVAKGGLKLREGDEVGGMSAGTTMIRYNAGTMGELAGQLSGYVGRHVVDQTGLAGKYAIRLSFAPVELVSEGPGEARQDVLPSIFQALQEQAGLKMDSVKGPVEVLVIDRAEKPTEN